MQIINDQSCFWINDLEPRNKIKSLLNNDICDFIIIGAGYTGLSAARTLSKLNPEKKIIIVDAQLAGEGASSRNSGYLVDTTLNEGFISTKNISAYQKKTNLYQAGIASVKKYIQEHQVDCDWNECGKYYASSDLNDLKILNNFSKNLKAQNIKHQILSEEELKKKLGTSFYKTGLYTNSGILLHPGKLARSMIKTLPSNVHLFEKTQLTNWEEKKDFIICKFKEYSINSKKIIFCNNGFFSSLNIKKNYNFPITLTASTTRPLTQIELNEMGNPSEWGVLSVKPMGATIRLTKDKRISIRNTAEIKNPNFMSNEDLKERKKMHLKGIQKRFPYLPDDIIESTWSGVACRSGNGSQLFEKINEKIFIAGCFNGAGIGLGILFGEQIAMKASNESTIETELIENRTKPNWLPPQPFLNLGIKLKLMFERTRAAQEI